MVLGTGLQATIEALQRVWTQLGDPDKDDKINAIRDIALKLVQDRVDNDQEKLQQLQKLQQDRCAEISALANRLHEFGHGQTGELLLKKTLDPALNSSIFHKCHLLDQLLEQLQHKQQVIINVLAGFLERIQALYTDLGTEIPEELIEVGEDISVQRLQYAEAAFEQAKSEKEERTKKVADLVARIGNLLQELGLLDSADLCEVDRLVLRNEHGRIGVSCESMKTLQDRLQQLQQRKQEVIDTIAGLMQRIESRWTKLEVAETDRASFQDKVSGVDAAALSQYRAELTRLDELFKERLSCLVEAAGYRIEDLRASLRFGDQPLDQGSIVVAIRPEEELHPASEAVLQLLEEDEAALQQQIQSLGQFFSLVNKHFDYAALVRDGKRAALENANDPNRFRGRHAFKMLKKEETLRTLETKTLPRLGNKIVSIAQEWTQESGRPITINGESVEEALAVCSTTPPEAVQAEGGKNMARQALLRRQSLSVVSKSAPSHRRLSYAPSSASTPLMNTPKLRRAASSAASASNTSAEAVGKVPFAADAALQSSDSDREMDRLNQEIATLEQIRPRDKALCDLYHQRSVLYSRVGDFRLAVHDSNRCLELSASAHGHLSIGRRYDAEVDAVYLRAANGFSRHRRCSSSL